MTYSFEMPSGWIAENGGQTISKHPNESGREVGWSVSIVDRLFGDPCGPDTTIDIGPTTRDLMAALAGLPGPQVSKPLDVTIDGRPGQRLELTVPADIDVEACDPPIGLQLWLDMSGNKYFVAGPESTANVLAVDVDGSRFVAVFGAANTAAPADVAEIEAIIASIGLEP